MSRLNLELSALDSSYFRPWGAPPMLPISSVALLLSHALLSKKLLFRNARFPEE
jgi:hypothetical protein